MARSAVAVDTPANPVAADAYNAQFTSPEHIHTDYYYGPLRPATSDLHRGMIQAHHLIEKRFAAVVDQNVDDMASIVVTRTEHQVFTNAWRAEIAYGSRNVTPEQVSSAARRIYADYPEILQALELE